MGISATRGGFGDYGFRDGQIWKLYGDKMDLQPSDCGKPSVFLREIPLMRLVMIFLMISGAIAADASPPLEWGLVAEVKQRLMRLSPEQCDRIYTVEGLLAAIRDAP